MLGAGARAMRAAGPMRARSTTPADLARYFGVGRAACRSGWHDTDDRGHHPELVAIRGIGRWTAEDVPDLHTWLRPNVLLARRRRPAVSGISRAYFGAGEPVSRSEERVRSPPPGRLLQRRDLVYLALVALSGRATGSRPALLRSVFTSRVATLA